jgi:hypothetical protein
MDGARRPSGARCERFGEFLGDCFGNRPVVQAEAAGEAGYLAADVGRRHGRDEIVRAENHVHVMRPGDIR